MERNIAVLIVNWSLFLLFTLFVFSAPRAWAMEKTDDIDTNRPSFMFSPLVVPNGSVQLENGTIYQHFPHGNNGFDIPETQIRLGVARRSEFQMFVPNYFLAHQEHSHLTRSVASGLGEVGIKQQIGPLKKLQLCLIPSMNIPTGSITGRGVEPVFRAPWSYPLTKNCSIMGMQSLLLLNRGRNVQYQPDFMLNRTIGARAGVFAEYVGFFTHHAPHLQIAHFGGVYKLNRNHQLDMHFGFGLDKTAPAAFVGAGYSFRFDGLPWN